MDWASFIMALLKMLQECMEERRKEAVVDGMLNPGLRERFAAHRLLKEQGYHGRELRMEVTVAMQYLADLDAEDIECLLEDAKAYGGAQ